MGQQPLRFGIHDGAGHRSATWKLWTEKGANGSEVYLTCRELNGALHASLHESGEWHVAYPPHVFEEDVKGAIPNVNNRFLEKWFRPPDFAPGHTMAFKIKTPWTAVNTPVKGGTFKRVKWLPSAPEPMASEIDILITRYATYVTGWPGHQSMGTSLIGSIPLENGETLWAVYWFCDMPDFSNFPKEAPGWYYKDKGEKDLKNLKQGDSRVLVFGTEPDGSHVIVDGALQIEKRNG